MGYSASIIDSDGDLILQAARLPAVLDRLRRAEGGGAFGHARLRAHRVPRGHISWCDPISSYEAQYTDMPDDVRTRRLVIDIIRSYGFEDTASALNDQAECTGDVVVEGWRGDKLGSSYEDIMEAIALGLDPKLTIVQFWAGEDNEIWGARFARGKFTTHAVALELVEGT